MKRIRDYWYRTPPPKFCRGCGSQLMYGTEEDRTAPRYDPEVGFPLAPVVKNIAWCQNGDTPEGRADTDVWHDDWWLADLLPPLMPFVEAT